MIVRVHNFGGYLDVYEGSKAISANDDSCDKSLSLREVFPSADHWNEICDSCSDPSQYAKATNERHNGFCKAWNKNALQRDTSSKRNDSIVKRFEIELITDLFITYILGLNLFSLTK